MAVPCVGVITIKDNEVLVVRHESNSGYDNHIDGLPSGRLETGETDIQAAAREFCEETGLETYTDQLIEFPGNYFIGKLPHRKNPAEANTEYSWRVYLCKSYTGSITPSTETTPEWITISDLEKYDLLPNVKNAVMAALEFLNHS